MIKEEEKPVLSYDKKIVGYILKKVSYYPDKKIEFVFKTLSGYCLGSDLLREVATLLDEYNKKGGF